jgi:hypothetical protein
LGQLPSAASSSIAAAWLLAGLDRPFGHIASWDHFGPSATDPSSAVATLPD